jgi:hypothetical protein
VVVSDASSMEALGLGRRLGLGEESLCTMLGHTLHPKFSANLDSKLVKTDMFADSCPFVASHCHIPSDREVFFKYYYLFIF